MKLIVGETGTLDLEFLHEIGSRMAVADPLHEVLARILELATASVECDSCFIYVLEGEELVLRASKNPHAEVLDRLALPVGQGITGWVIVIAIDAPVDGRGLQRLAARGVYALGRTGSDYANGSGDFAIAFSTSPTMHTHPDEVAPHTRTVLPAEAMSPLFEAVLEATEEAVYNSMLQATTVTTKFGNETHVGQEIPVDKVREILARYGIK